LIVSSRVVSRNRIRVALIATHPIQYQVPWFRALAARPELDLKVLYGLMPDATQQGVEFGIGFQWDIPLLDGYQWDVLRNVALRPSLGSIGGCDTPGVSDALQTWAPDAVILTGWHSKMLIQAWWASLRLRIPRILRCEANALRHRPRWKRSLHALWLRGFNEFLAIGHANRDFYGQAGVSIDRIHDCPYFVDNERFGADADVWRERRAALRDEWAIPPDATCFLFCGKLIPKKRPLDLLHALRRALAAGASTHLLIVGDGELLSQVKTMAHAERLPVTFAGFLNQTEISRAYVAADCFVLGSDAGETWGLVVNEAMACGLPAIISDEVGCGPDLVTDGVTGAIYATGDVDALAKQMIAMAGDHAKMRAMGTQARLRVQSRYSIGRAVEGTVAAIGAAMARR
jgi:glycosyltransferase involved in cell wall biosynthesis